MTPAAQPSRGPGRLGSLKRLWTPVVGLAILAVMSRVAGGFVFDPLRGAQSPRLSFSPLQAPDSPTEGFALVRPLFPPDSPWRDLTGPVPENTPATLTILFAGNSQTIATMDEQPGDRYSPVWFWQGVNSGPGPERYPLRLASEPNLRVSELVMKGVLGAADPKRKVDVLVASLVLDGLRWVDPRESVARLAADPQVRRETLALLEESADLPAAKRVIEGILDQSAGEAGEGPENPARLAVRWESTLQEFGDRNLTLMHERRSMYGWVLAHAVAARNAALGVSTATRRPISEGMYETNLQLLEGLLRHLAARDVHAVLYFAPVRPIEPNPLDPADAERFRRDLASLCAKYGAVYLDYSGLIPEEMWTNYPDQEVGKGGERDYAHFTGRAHQRLGERLAADLKPRLDEWLDEKAGR